MLKCTREGTVKVKKLGGLINGKKAVAYDYFCPRHIAAWYAFADVATPAMRGAKIVHSGIQDALNSKEES